MFERKPINLIGVADDAMNEVDGPTHPLGIVRLFNLTTSQAFAVLHKERLVLGCTGAFSADVRSRRCTVLRNDWGRAGTARCVDKLLDKYPDFKVHIPEENFLGDKLRWHCFKEQWIDKE
ncbi:hypothetical protein [Stappia phage SI01]|uniref:Uncharacterized protein n=1 Tax=Stappia phage SI01 TaxID=2847766 RepID=A0AAE7VHJ6_9CAUD|nr:hypothetical protein [Stappia phage SI01]